jgi:hypothetical protein
MDVITLARQWREENGYIGRGGVVVVFDGVVNSWVNALRNPKHWKPGSIAVDEAGCSWTTIVGSEQDGSLMWLPNDPFMDAD